jgi:carboxyl-terminal processing protease
MKHRFYHPLALGLILTVVGLGVLPGCQFFNPRPAEIGPADAGPGYRLMTEAWDTMNRVYVDRSALNSKKITYGAISGMVDSLGDTGHSRFLTPEMVKHERNLTEGHLEGIGAQVRMKNNQVVIVAPMDDSPAQKAGLKPGDIIVAVNGEEVGTLALDEVVNKILGPPGTPVTLNILNPNTGLARDANLIRARITIHNITWQRLPGAAVVHLRIASFSKGVTTDLRKALAHIREDGARGLILDLRNNPGGLLDQSVDAASQFLAGGTVYLEKNAKGEIKPIPVKPGGLAIDLPMAILINGGTSSGAEIVAGALKSAHRARLVGEKTFGTGTVLKTFPLSDGSALLLAIEEWLTPDGQVIWHRGIAPDEAVPLPPDATPLVPDREKGLTAEELKASGDAQLLRALELITHAEPEQPPKSGARQR